MALSTPHTRVSADPMSLATAMARLAMVVSSAKVSPSNPGGHKMPICDRTEVHQQAA